MRVLVCGGRDYDDAVTVDRVLDRVHSRRPITCVIHGGARGADSLAGAWAKRRGVRVEEYPADWKRYGRAAGMIRNAEMLRAGRPDRVVAFPGGRGTAGMKRLARTAGVPVEEAS